MIAVSACLVGKNVKYDGTNNYNESVIKYLEGKEYITICPEVFGGLPTPRFPSEIRRNKVINTNNEDVTKNFKDGATKALKTLENNDVDILIVKAKSPSCGYKEIYDGTFTHKVVSGNGVFVNLVEKKKIKIYTEKDIERIINEKD